MDYVVFVAVEVNLKPIARSANPSRHFKLSHARSPFSLAARSLPPKEEASLTASRLIGFSLDESQVVKRIWEAKRFPELQALGVNGVRLFRLKKANSVVVFSLGYPEGSLPSGGIQRLSAIKIQKILGIVGLNGCMDMSTSVYSIVGSLAPEGDAWLPLTSDGWLHIHGSYMDVRVLQQVVAQVAIERSILNFALLKRKWPASWFATPMSTRLIRSWAVEFLSDKQSITDNYHKLRASLNIPRVRAELLERSKHWWTVVSAGVAVAGFLVAVFAFA